MLIIGAGQLSQYLGEMASMLGYQVTVCDLLRRGNPLGLQVLEQDYNTLSPELLSEIDMIRWDMRDPAQ